MVFAAGVIWGFIGLFVNLLGDHGVRTEMIPAIRLGFTVVCMLPICVAIKGSALRSIDLNGLKYSALLGLVTQALFNLCYTRTITYVGVSTGAIMLYTAPVFTCIMSRLIYREEMGANKIIALFLNILGCILTVTGGNFHDMGFSAIGIAFGLATGFCYATLPIILKKATVDYDPMVIAFYAFVFGACFMFLIARGWQGTGADLGMPLIAVCVGYGLTTAAAYFLYTSGMARKIEASKAPVVASVEVVVAAIIGIAIYSESASPVKLIGIAIVILSIAVMNREKPIFTKVSQ